MENNRYWISKEKIGFVVYPFKYRIGLGLYFNYDNFQFNILRGEKSYTLYLAGLSLLLVASFGW
jgi:hypothetical protein